MQLKLLSKSNLIAITVAFSGFSAQAQTISNPGFETYSSCPTNVSQLNRATPWINALGGLAGTPDYFNCAYGITGADYGGISAQSGTGFTGGFAELNNTFSNYKEYLTIPLSTPLVAGTTYTFSFYVAHLYGTSRPATNFVSGITYTDLPGPEQGFLGAVFSTAAPVAANTEGNTSPGYNSIKNDFGLGRVMIPASNTAVYGTASRNTWVPVTLQYTAIGGETYMTIGQFRQGSTSLPALTGTYFLFDGFSSALTVLPVTFGDIHAELSNNQFNIDWQTHKETSNERFEIEASADGRVFTKIGTVPTRAPNGHSDTTLNYIFSGPAGEVALGAGLLMALLGSTLNKRRKTVAALLMSLSCGTILYSCSKSTGESLNDPDGQYFIRIAQIDKDGTTSYSKTVAVIKK